MNFKDKFFSYPLCLFKIEYTLSWFFFFLANSFFISIIILNPLNLEYGEDENVIKMIFCSVFIFIVSIFSRCICLTKNDNYDMEYVSGYYNV